MAPGFPASESQNWIRDDSLGKDDFRRQWAIDLHDIFQSIHVCPDQRIPAVWFKNFQDFGWLLLYREVIQRNRPRLERNAHTSVVFPSSLSASHTRWRKLIRLAKRLETSGEMISARFTRHGLLSRKLCPEYDWAEIWMCLVFQTLRAFYLDTVEAIMARNSSKCCTSALEWPLGIKPFKGQVMTNTHLMRFATFVNKVTNILRRFKKVGIGAILANIVRIDKEII